MIVYKLDKSVQIKASTQIKDMGGVLSEIAPTLRILRDLVIENQASISEQSVDQYREDLLQMIAEAIRLSHLITINSQRLCKVSDLAAKQLAVLDNQIIEALKGRNVEITENTPVPVETSNTQSLASASRTNNPMRFAKTFSRI